MGSFKKLQTLENACDTRSGSNRGILHIAFLDLESTKRSTSSIWGCSDRCHHNTLGPGDWRYGVSYR